MFFSMAGIRLVVTDPGLGVFPALLGLEQDQQVAGHLTLCFFWGGTLGKDYKVTQGEGKTLKK